MCNGDLSKWETVLDWNVLEALNKLAFIRDKQKLQEHQQKKLMSKYKV